VPIGGNKFTEALVSAFKISFKKAEKLKRNAASSKYAKQIFQAMRPVFADLVSEVQRSIGFYTSTHRDANITKIIGMGNAIKLPGLQKFLQQNLQMEVTKLNSFKHLRVAALEKKDEFEDNIMSMAVSYGLAVQGMGLAKVESSLLPIEFRRQMLWKKKKPWFAGAAAMLALGTGALWASNLSASGKLGDGNGTVSGAKSFGNDQVAYDAMLGARNQADPIQKAAIVAGAAQRLKSSFTKADKKSPNAGTIKLLAKYPDNNVFIPRIYDVIHEAIGSVTAPNIKAASTGKAYSDLAKRLPRESRHEVWIDAIYMGYAETPETLLGDVSKRSRPGWAVKMIGVTPLEQPAQWIEEKLVKEMLRIGLRPDRGFYIDSIKLEKVEKRKSNRSVSKSDLKDGGQVGGSRSGGRRGGGRRAGGGGRPGGRRDGPRLAGPGGGGRPPGGSHRAGGDDQVRKMLGTLRKGDVDFLTGESIKTDSVFTLKIIVRNSNTPAKLIPAEFKEKSADEKAKTP